MTLWKFSLRCAVPIVLALLLSGSSFLEKIARRKIQIYDFNQRKVIAVLDHVSPEYSTREIYELNPDFERKTFVTYQRFADKKRVKIRRYTFDGEQVGDWELPESEWFYTTQSFSMRDNWLVYQKDKKLMALDLSDLSKPARQLSPDIKGFEVPLTGVEPSFIWLTDKTILCMMRPKDLWEGWQLWKLSLTGEKELIRSDIKHTWPDNALSSDFSGTHHAIILNDQTVLLLDNHAQKIGQFGAPFEIGRCWWDDNARFWVYSYLTGDYRCYDVKSNTIVHSGNIPKEKETYVKLFFQNQYYVQCKYLLLTARVTVRDFLGKYVETLPSVTARLLHLGNGRFLVEED